MPPIRVDRWAARHNAMFAKEGRCLLYVDRFASLRDCRACRTIHYCAHYDRDGVLELERRALARWEDEGGGLPAK